MLLMSSLVEAALFGANASLFFWSLFIRKRKRIPWFLRISVYTIFLLSATHFILGIMILQPAITESYLDGSEDPLLTLDLMKSSLSWLSHRSLITVLTGILHDLTLLWRLWAAWDFSVRVCVIPGIIWVAYSAIFLTDAVLPYTSDTIIYNVGFQHRTIISSFVLTIVDNAIMTVLFIIKIISLKRLIQPVAHKAEQLRYFNSALIVISVYSTVYIAALIALPISDIYSPWPVGILSSTISCHLNANLPILFTLRSLLNVST